MTSALQACSGFNSFILVSPSVSDDETRIVDILPPSPEEKLTLVGWYYYKQPNKVALDNRLAGFSQCAPVRVPVGSAQFADPSIHATPETYCYEPSGAHGMTLPNSDFNLLTSYIFQPGSAFQSVAKLDDLFANPADLVSDNLCNREALFYYALSYVMVPRSYNLSDTANDIRFSFSDVDDGLQLIANGRVVGRGRIGEGPVSFSLHKGRNGNLSALNIGANTLVALWVDDCAIARLIQDAQVTNGRGTPIALARPNLVNGYVYNKTSAVGVANTTIEVRNEQNVLLFSTVTDEKGFYQFEGLPDGVLKFNVFKVGVPVATKNTVLNHKAATTAAVNLNFGL